MALIRNRGTGIVEVPFVADKYKCPRYGSFMHNLSAWQLNFVFWGLFVYVLVMLVFSSHYFDTSELQRQSFLRKEAELAGEDQTAEAKRLIEAYTAEYKTEAWRCTIVTIIILPLMFTSMYMEAIAALSLQFCHGEDLMMFHWGPWTLFQCGSFIAEVGLVISQLQNCLHSHHPTPPWAVALGTPVPVICGMVHYAKNTIKDRTSRNQNNESSNNNIPLQMSLHRDRQVSRTHETAVVQPQAPEPQDLPEGAQVYELANGEGFLVNYPILTINNDPSTDPSSSRESSAADTPPPNARESS